jgi:hypothetical protein
MKNLWFFTRKYNKSSTVPLPSYLSVSFANPEMNRRICEERDIAVRVLGRCVEALVVNKLATDINSRRIPASNDELACISAILGTEGNDVELSPSYLGAIKFTKMVFLALDNFYSFTDEILPSDIPIVVQETFGILSQDISAELNAMMPPAQMDTLVNLSHGQFEHDCNPMFIV